MSGKDYSAVAAAPLVTTWFLSSATDDLRLPSQLPGKAFTLGRFTIDRLIYQSGHVSSLAKRNPAAVK